MRIYLFLLEIQHSLIGSADQIGEVFVEILDSQGCDLVVYQLL